MSIAPQHIRIGNWLIQHRRLFLFLQEIGYLHHDEKMTDDQRRSLGLTWVICGLASDVPTPSAKKSTAVSTTTATPKGTVADPLFTFDGSEETEYLNLEDEPTLFYAHPVNSNAVIGTKEELRDFLTWVTSTLMTLNRDTEQMYVYHFSIFTIQEPSTWADKFSNIRAS